MCVVVEGRQGRRERRDEGDQKSVQTHCQVRVIGLTTNKRCSICEGSYLSQKVWSPYDIKMVPYQFGVALHDGALRLARKLCLGGFTSIYSVPALGP